MLAFFGMPGHLELLIIAGILCAVVGPGVLAATLLVILLAGRASRSGQETIGQKPSIEIHPSDPSGTESAGKSAERGTKNHEG